MVVAMKVDYRRYKHPAVVFSLLGLTTLMLISRLFPRPRPQYAPLDSLRRLLLPAVGSGQAGDHSFSRFLSGEPNQIHE